MYPTTQEQYALLGDRYGASNLARVKAEQAACRRLIKAALKQGWTISVYDSEEWAIKRSSNFKDIEKACGNTDEDTFIFRNADGEKVGRVYLVYGNGADDLVCDFTLDCEAFLREHNFY